MTDDNTQDRQTSTQGRELTLGRDLCPGDVLLGDAGGLSQIDEVSSSSAMPGLLVVETEHGPLYLDPDEEYSVTRSGR